MSQIEIIDRGAMCEGFQFLVRDDKEGLEAGFNTREDAELFKAAKERLAKDFPGDGPVYQINIPHGLTLIEALRRSKETGERFRRGPDAIGGYGPVQVYHGADAKSLHMEDILADDWEPVPGTMDANKVQESMERLLDKRFWGKPVLDVLHEWQRKTGQLRTNETDPVPYRQHSAELGSVSKEEAECLRLPSGDIIVTLPGGGRKLITGRRDEAGMPLVEPINIDKMVDSVVEAIHRNSVAVGQSAENITIFNTEEEAREAILNQLGGCQCKSFLQGHELGCPLAEKK